MKHSVMRWILDGALTRSEPYPVRLTPGQATSLFRELNGGTSSVRTPLGMHPIEVVDYHGRGIGDNIVLAPRLDLFSDLEIGMVSSANSVTSVPDNVACVEVIDEGNAPHLKRGDLVFIDMMRTKQANVLQSDMLYIAGGADFIARYDEQTAEIEAIDNYVLTRPAPTRMTLAMFGTTSFDAPRNLISDGFVSGLRHDGRPNARCVYQEVYDIGVLTARDAQGRMTKLEAKLLDALARREDALWLVERLIAEREWGRDPDVEVGDLVSFCTDIGTRLRIRGEYHYAVPHKNLLMVVDDGAIARERLKKAV
jgi:hypothetical protein